MTMTTAIQIGALVFMTLLPIALSGILYVVERQQWTKKISYAVKQAIIGVLFGLIAVLATEVGIPVNGAVLNVRNAAPLTAGLLFGGPAGIIAGLIGGVYRWFATCWGAGAFSRVACTIGTILAGFFGAGCRKYMFDNKKPNWFYGLAIGLTTEVLHMLLVFLTNMGDIYTAFQVVQKCAAPMIVCNGVSVMLSLLLVSFIGKEKVVRRKGAYQLSQMFQFLLLICVVVAFAVTCVFTDSLQTRIAYANADQLLKLNLDDVETDVRDVSDNNLLHIAEAVAARVTAESTREDLAALAERYDVAGINLIDENGIVTESTLADFVGFDMASGAQAAEFLCLLDGVETFVQSYQPLSADSSISRKYAGVTLPEGGFVQVGYDADQFQSAIAGQVRQAVRNRHIGQTGGIIVCDNTLTIISDNGGHAGRSAFSVNDAAASMQIQPGIRFEAEINNTDSYCMLRMTEGFYLIATIPVTEAMFSRNIAITIQIFMEVVVFAALFTHIYFLIKRLIVDNIHKINGSLSQITDGDLNVHVNVRENQEFASLSDDINATVDTLKRYIEEAEQRIDRELEFARQIQRSSLPSVFPPYPERKDFDIYSSMEAAKEVGGDFYDFYLADTSHLHFLVADVSGKGIPGALFMMRAKTLLRNLAESGRDIAEVFTEANSGLCENNDAEMFVTAWLGSLDLQSGLLEYVNAGHNPPLLRNGGAFEYLRTKPNFVLAGLDITRYKKHEVQLAPGAQVFLYTDGVTEAVNAANELYGEERLEQILNKKQGTPQELCANLHADIDDFVQDAEQSDDITMLCVTWNGAAAKEEWR